jgi:hypothetical protein
LVLCITPLHAAQSTFRTFSDSTGREMDAKLTQVSGDDVYIERRNGLTTKLDISIFSKEDKEYIRDWARTAALKDDAIDIKNIRIKVYVDDILATEVSKPENLMRKEKWSTSKS